MTVRYELDRAVALITIDRPPVNAYDAELERELRGAWHRAADDERVRAVVLRATGPHFCAGVDRASMAGERRGLVEADETPGAAMAFVRDLPKPTIAAVQGGCIGGGQRFVFPCDLVFCSEDAFFSDPLITMGYGGIPAPLHLWMYGPRVAKEMVFSGMRVPATRLFEMGTVNRVYPRERLWDETSAFAQEIAAMDAAALRRGKEEVNRALDIMGQGEVAKRFDELLTH
jgi:enoyl-CoA hydratase/carnithine racemase